MSTNYRGKVSTRPDHALVKALGQIDCTQEWLAEQLGVADGTLSSHITGRRGKGLRGQHVVKIVEILRQRGIDVTFEQVVRG